MELVSIIVPMFNAEKMIGKCVNSIITQSYPQIEIILINDGSVDKTLEICEKFCEKDARICLINKTNGGVSSARNAGIEQAQGEWICFVDADDFLDKEYVKELIDATQISNIDIVIAGVNEIYDTKIYSKRHNTDRIVIFQGDARLQIMYSILNNKTDGRKIINSQVIGYSWAKMYRKRTIGAIRFHENIPVREDALFNLDVINSSKLILAIGNSLYNYVIHRKSATGKFRNSYSKEVIEFLNCCKERCVNYNIPQNVYSSAVLYAYMSWLKMYALHEDSNFSFVEKERLIKASFKEKIWLDGFRGVDISALPFPYKVLKVLFDFKLSTGIMCLYMLSRILLRK